MTLLLLGLACSGPPPGDDSAAGGFATNVLIVSLDTIRPWDQVHDPEVMPWLAAHLATRGLLLTRPFTVGTWTYSSMAAALTGMYPMTWGDVAFLPGEAGFPALPEEAETLAELLGARGFATYLNTGNGVLHHHTGLQQGFVDPVFDRSTVSAPADTLAWIKAQSGPWYAHLHFNTTHSPYVELAASCLDAVTAVAPACPYDLGNGDIWVTMNEEAPGWTAETAAACQDAVRVANRCEATFLDTVLAAFWEEVERAGLLDDTVVALFNDHGELWGESVRGAVTFSHDLTLQATNTAGVGWMTWPGVEDGTRVEVATSQVDFVPSLLGRLGLPAEGFSGVPVWEADVDRYLYQTWCRGDIADGVVTGDGAHHLVRYHDGRTEYYRPDDDPREATPLDASLIPSDLLAAAEAQGIATTDMCGPESKAGE